jgi:hypothetical protein
MKRTDMIQRRRKRNEFLRKSNAAAMAVIAASNAAMEEDEEEDDDEPEESTEQANPDEESPKPEGEAKVENPEAEPEKKPDEEGQPPAIKTEEDEDEEDDEIDAECDDRKMKAEQIEQAAIMAFNPYHDRSGRFTSKDGAELGDEEANAARDLASATGRAASKGVVSHKVAKETYEQAAREAERVAKRSAEEFDKATERGDKLGQAAHMAEANRAAANVLTFRKMAQEHASTPDVTPSSAAATPATGTIASPVQQSGRNSVLRSIGNAAVAEFQRTATEIAVSKVRQGVQTAATKGEKALVDTVAPKAWSMAKKAPHAASEAGRAVGAYLTSSGMRSVPRPKPGEGFSLPGRTWEPYSSSFGTSSERPSSSFSVGGYAPSARTFRRASAMRRGMSASECSAATIIASIVAMEEKKKRIATPLWLKYLPSIPITGQTESLHRRMVDQAERGLS